MVKGNVRRDVKAGVFGDPGFGGFHLSLAGPDLPGKHDPLTRPGSDGAAEISLAAVRYVVFPGVDSFQAAVFLEQRGAGLGPGFVSLEVLLGDGDHKSGDIHGGSSKWRRGQHPA